MNTSLENKGEIFAVCYFVLDNFNSSPNSSPDFWPPPKSESPVFTEFCVKFGFSIACFRAIFEVWSRDCCVHGDVDHGGIICDSVLLRSKQPEDCSAIFLQSERNIAECPWGKKPLSKVTCAPAHQLHGGCRKALWERHQPSGGCWAGSASSRACMSSCLTHASEQQEGCWPQELPLAVRVTALSWQLPGPIFRSGICTSAVESSCTQHPQVTPLPFALRRPPDCFSGSSSEQLSSHVVQSIWVTFTSLHATCPRGRLSKSPSRAACPWAQDTLSHMALSEERLSRTLHVPPLPQHSLRQDCPWLTLSHGCGRVERNRKEL